MDTLSGNLRVKIRSRHRRGVCPPTRPAMDPSPENQAASDDGSGTTDELAANSGAVSTDRKPRAEAAQVQAEEVARTPENKIAGNEPPENTEELPRAHDPAKEQWSPRIFMDEGEMQVAEELPTDARALVEAINKGVYMVGVGKSLLLEKDIKVKQRVWEQLIDLAYGKNPEVKETARQVIHDLPRPLRD